MNLTNVIFGLLTENIIIAGILLMMLAEMLRMKWKWSLVITLTTLLGVLASLLLGKSNPSYATFYISDDITNILKASLLLLSLPLLIVLRSRFWNFKAQTLFLSALLGSCLMISAQNFIVNPSRLPP